MVKHFKGWMAICCLVCLLMGLLSACGGQKAEPVESTPEPTETTAPTETPEPTETPPTVTEEEQLFVSSLLAAMYGEDFSDTRQLVAEKIAAILLNVPDIEFAASSPTTAFLDYYEEDTGMSGTYYMVSGRDLEIASETIFGRRVSPDQVTALDERFIYLFSDDACGRSIGVGHGENFAVEISDIRYSGDQIEVFYSIYSTNPYKPDAVPTDAVYYIAVFERNDSQSAYPFRILSNRQEGDTRSAEQLAVTKAYEQLMEYGLVMDGQDSFGILTRLKNCSFLTGDTDPYMDTLVADCYLLNLDSDVDPEMVVECGQAEVTSIILDYADGGFRKTSAYGSFARRTNGGYYIISPIVGASDEGQDLYRINPATLEAELEERQLASLGNYSFWAFSDEFSVPPAVPKNESKTILVEDAVDAYYAHG